MSVQWVCLTSCLHQMLMFHWRVLALRMNCHGCEELIVTAREDPVVLWCNAYFLLIIQDAEDMKTKMIKCAIIVALFKHQVCLLHSYMKLANSNDFYISQLCAILHKTCAFYTYIELIIPMFLLVEYFVRPTIFTEQNHSQVTQLQRS
jgi:hypothetical protein